MSQQWAFTVQYNKQDGMARSDILLNYDTIFKIWRELHNVDIVYKNMEIGGKCNRIHFHGVASIPNRLFRKQLRIEGFIVMFRKLFNECKWHEYCTKQTDDLSSDNENESVTVPTRKLF